MDLLVKRKILILFFLISLSSIFINGVLSQVEEFEVIQSVDDAHETGNGSFSYTDTEVYINSYSGPTSVNYKCGGLRFKNITIPRGSIIVSANLTVETFDTDYDSARFTIYGHDVDDSVNFADNPNIINTRSFTDANLTFIYANMGTGLKTIHGLESIVYEITSRDNWVSGNDLTFLLIASTDLDNWGFKFYSYDFDDNSHSAVLQIVWLEPEEEPTFFEELLTGDGAFIGFVLVASLMIVVTSFEKMAGLLFIMVSVFLSVYCAVNIPTNSDFFWSTIFYGFLPLILIFVMLKE